MAHTYEIVTRGKDEHRTGHHTLLIDGVESELTVDPAQFMPKALAEAKGDLSKAQGICKDYAERALQRRVDKLRAGSLIPGGVPFSPLGGLDVARVPRRARRTEAEAVAAYLNRGSLKDLTPRARKERRDRRNEKFDNEKDWQDRRKALIKLRQTDLKEVEAKLKKDPTNGKLLRDRDVLRVELAALQIGVLAASHGFQYAYTQYLTKQIDLVNDDIRIWPLMTNTTLDTVRDAVDTFSDVTADEFDGAGYVSGGLALDSQAVAVDDANDRAEFDAADEVVTGLGAGTRSIQGVALGKFNTNTAASLPLHWIQFASDKTPDGSDFTFVFNAEGILQAADG